MKGNIKEQQEGRLSRWLNVGTLACKPELITDLQSTCNPYTYEKEQRDPGVSRQDRELVSVKNKRTVKEDTQSPWIQVCVHLHTYIYAYIHDYIWTHNTHMSKSHRWFHKLWEYPTSMPFNLWVLIECLLYPGHRDKTMEQTGNTLEDTSKHY